VFGFRPAGSVSCMYILSFTYFPSLNIHWGYGLGFLDRFMAKMFVSISITVPRQCLLRHSTGALEVSCKSIE
jgi:hypothetical protein